MAPSIELKILFKSKNYSRPFTVSKFTRTLTNLFTYSKYIIVSSLAT